MAGLNRIVLVDDEDDIRSVAIMALETVGGYEVTQYASGVDFMKDMAGLEADLILMDVMMPEQDGPATLARFQQLKGEDAIPVIFMTAKTQTHEIEHFLSLGAKGVIPKPFDPMTLCDQIEKLWSSL